MTIKLNDNQLPENLDQLPATKAFVDGLRGQAVRGGSDIDALVLSAVRAFKSIDDRLAALEEK